MEETGAKLPTLSRLTEDKLFIYYQIKKSGDSEEELAEALNQLDDKWVLKAEKIGYAILAIKDNIKLLGEMIKLANEEVDRLKELKKATERNLDNLEQYTITQFLANEETYPPQDKRVNPIWRYSGFKMEVTEPTISVDVLNKDIVEAAFLDPVTTFKVNKQRVRMVFEAGQKVIFEGLNIKRKRHLIVR